MKPETLAPPATIVPEAKRSGRAGVRNLKSEITSAAALWLVATLFIALAIANGIVSDWFFARLNAHLILTATLIELGAAIFYLCRARRVEIVVDKEELFAFLLLVVSITAYLIYPSLPGLLPPARHFDAVNHTIHTQFIYENNTLPHDFSGGVPPYYMSGYPAGGALFGALVSHWLGTLPIQTIHPIISFILALAAGFVFITANNLLRATQHATGQTATASRTCTRQRPPSRSEIEPTKVGFAVTCRDTCPCGRCKGFNRTVPLAFLSAMFLPTAWAYFTGSVNDRYFYAQTVAQFFALATFFFALQYWETRDTLWLVLMPFAISIVLVSHPTPIVAPMLAAFATILLHPQTARREKFAHAIIVAAGLAPVAIIYVIPHFPHWVALTGYGEAVPFDLESIGIILPTLAIIGGALALRQAWRDSFGVVALFALFVLAQPTALFIARFFLPAISPYYFEKSVYLLIYPLAILAALPISRFTFHVSSFRFHASGFPLPTPRFAFYVLRFLPWLFAFCFLLSAFYLFPPRPFAPLTLNEFKAAQWAKAHLDPKNIAVVSGIREDAYWVQWPLLGNGPSERVTAGAYHLGALTYDEWRGNPREPDYAIVRNLARVPKDATVQIVQQIGESAILYKPRAEPSPAPTPKFKTNYAVEDVFKLVGYDTADKWRAGAPISITFYWHTRQWYVTRTSIFVQVVDPRGNVATRDEREMFGGKYPTHRWPLGVTLEDTWNFNLPTDASAGDYTLEVVLYSQLTGARVEILNSAQQPSDQINLFPFRVE